VLWGENLRGGGYRLRGVSGVLTEVAADQLLDLRFTGAGLVAEVRRDGESWLRYWPMDGDDFAGPVEQRLLGSVIGGSGDLLFVRHGALLGALQYREGTLAPLVGLDVGGEVRAAVVDGGRLAVLTDSELVLIRPRASRLPHLAETARFTLAGYQGMALSGDEVLVWNPTGDVKRLRLVGGAADRSLQELGSLALAGAVEQVVWDGEISWIQLLLPDGRSAWQAWQELEPLGTLPAQTRELAFGPGHLYRLEDAVDGGTLIRHDIAVDATSQTPTATAQALPFGVLVTLQDADTRTGLASIHFRDETGRRLPAEPHWYSGDLDEQLMQPAVPVRPGSWIRRCSPMGSCCTVPTMPRTGNRSPW
jgi:hypothetical protein